MKCLDELQHDRGAAEAFLEALAGESRALFAFQTYDDEARERARQKAIERGAKLPTKANPRTVILNGTLGECWVRLQVLNLNGAGVFVTEQLCGCAQGRGCPAEARRSPTVDAASTAS